MYQPSEWYNYPANLGAATGNLVNDIIEILGFSDPTSAPSEVINITKQLVDDIFSDEIRRIEYTGQTPGRDTLFSNVLQKHANTVYQLKQATDKAYNDASGALTNVKSGWYNQNGLNKIGSALEGWFKNLFGQKSDKAKDTEKMNEATNKYKQTAQEAQKQLQASKEELHHAAQQLHTDQNRTATAVATQIRKEADNAIQTKEK